MAPGVLSRSAGSWSEVRTSAAADRAPYSSAAGWAPAQDQDAGILEQQGMICVAAVQAYPVQVDASPSRGLWLVKWILVIPHYIVLSFLWVAFIMLSPVAMVAIVVTGRPALAETAAGPAATSTARMRAAGSRPGRPRGPSRSRSMAGPSQGRTDLADQPSALG